MIKKISMLLSILVVTSAMILGAANPVFAQTTTPPAGSLVYQNEDDAWFLNVANALQMSVADLKTALSGGQTVQQIAQQKNISLDTVINAVTANRAAQLQIAVQAGKLTQDQANQLLAGLKTGYTFWFSTGKAPEIWRERDIASDNLAILASQLSMTPHDLREALRSGETVAQLAQEKGVNLDSLVTDVTAIRAAQLQKAVAAGKLTQDQANQILANLQNGFTYWFNNGKPPEDWHDRAIADDHIEQLASQLGITPGQLQDDLKSGETIAQLAQEKGISVDSLVSELTANRTAQILQEVKDGKLTQDQANNLLNGLKNGYTQWFNTGKPPVDWSRDEISDDRIEILSNQLGMPVNQIKDDLKSGETIAQLAQEKGISVSTLVTDITASRAAALQKEVAAGKLTQDQANQILTNLQKGYTTWFSNGKPPDGWSDRAVADQHIEVLANQLGITPGQLKDDLKSGETLNQLAQEKGVSVDTLVTDITANRAAELQKEVAAGKMTQDQATQILTNLQNGYNQWFTTGKPPEGWKDRALTEDHVTVVAKQLGLTPDQLRDDLKSGQTLDQLAQEKGVSLDSLASDVTKGAANALQKQVTSGKLTQDQANARLAQLQQQELERLKNAKHPLIVHPKGQKAPSAPTTTGG